MFKLNVNDVLHRVKTEKLSDFCVQKKLYKSLTMTIIKNAIDSIQIGIEDHQANDDRRNISAVRNISAGILLLYKEKLCQLSPKDNKELLIKQNIRPVRTEDGTIQFEGKGHKTVDVQSIKDRFKSLNIEVDWSRFDNINRLRNDLEHYYTSESPDTVREIIAKSFLLIRDFLTEQLKLDPQEVLGNNAWSVLLSVTEIYMAEEKSCQISLEKVDWVYSTVTDSIKYLRCTNCHSSLIEAPDSDEYYTSIPLRCRSCNEDFTFDEVIEQCIDDSLGGEAIQSVMDGDHTPYDTCLSCDKETFIYAEGKCVACEYEMEHTSCEMCGEGLRLEDQWNEGKCGYCQYKWEKVMAE